MKRTTKILTLAIVAVLSLSAIAVTAEEGKKVWKKAERPAFSMKEHKAYKKAERKDIKEVLAEMLESGKLTQEEYDEKIAKIESGEFKTGKKEKSEKFKGNFGKKPEMSEEKKAEIIEKRKECLGKMLEKGKITQEQYDKQLENIEKGSFGMGGMHRKGIKGMPMGKGRGQGMRKFRPAEEKAE